METNDIKTIGWIGLGKMGLPICRRLTEAGFGVTVYARNEASAAKATAEGFAIERDLGKLASADVVISAITDDTALLGFATPDFIKALRSGQIVIDISTVSPTASAELAARISPTGASYLRAPVSGSTTHAANG